MQTACAVSIDETSLISELEEPAADVRLATPEGYVQSETLVFGDHWLSEHAEAHLSTHHHWLGHAFIKY